MRLVVAMLSLSASATACAYHPGSFQYGRYFPGQQATLGCLDVTIDRRADYEASAVFDYSFGNRCNQPAMLDFSSVEVLATTPSGEQIELYPFDPERVIRPLPIEGRLGGHEVISYPLPQLAASICVDAASIVHQSPPHWMCFASQTPRVDVARGDL